MTGLTEYEASGLYAGIGRGANCVTKGAVAGATRAAEVNGCGNNRLNKTAGSAVTADHSANTNTCKR